MNTRLQRLGDSLRRHADRALLASAALLLAGCLFAPSWPIERDLYDEIVVLDVTQSMNVPDAQIGSAAASRLDAAKHALREILARLPCGSRIGWGAFTEHRLLLLIEPIEVCAHLGELRATLAAIDHRIAWSGNSEVAKAVHASIRTARQVPGTPALVFVTDGHEAPPLNPRYRPRFDGQPGEVAGLIVGVGSLLPSRIPKIDPSGRPLGYWGADEVLQTDPRSLGRAGSLSGEQLVDDGAEPAATPLPGATPGSEHLSALREAYLQLLAGETGLRYHHFASTDALAAAMTDASLARPVVARTPLAPLLALVALGLLLARHRRALQRLLRAGFSPLRGAASATYNPRP